MSEEPVIIQGPEDRHLTPVAPAMAPDGLNDQALIGQVQAGSQAALETLYERYAPSVMGVALKILGDRAAAEEVVQEVFWRAWRRADSFRSRRGAFSSWLFGITRNLAVDTMRRRQARPQAVESHDEREAGRDMADPAMNVPESAWAAIKHRQVRAAMKELPPAQRRVIELAYFSGLTRQEIAEQCQIPLGTVHTRARLGLQKLRQALQEQGFEE